MKKITLLVSSRHVVEALNSLRQLGVVHIEHVQNPHAHYISEIEHKISNVEKALAVIENLDSKVESSKNKDLLFPRSENLERIKEVIFLGNQEQSLTQRLNKLQERNIWFQEWGNICESVLEELSQSQVFIKLYIGNKKDFNRKTRDELVHIVKRSRNDIYFAHISESERALPGFTEIKVPGENLHSLNRKISSVSKELNHVNKELAQALRYKSIFLNHKKELLKGLEFCKVRFGMGYSEGICYLQGFCPKELIGEITKCAKAQGWATIISDPQDSSQVPILIRNPKWLKVIEPVFKFIETLPGYKEYDISFWFLLFFSLFFAMIIGDAGYGLIFLTATFIAQRKFKKAPQEPFFLIYVLSSATVIWGVITGTWFGSEQIAKIPFLNSLIISKINTFVSANQLFVIYLCFLIGAIHLTIAHLIVASRKINSLVALSHIGWVNVLWGMFFLAGKLVLGRPFPAFAMWLLYGGLGLILLFSNPQKNILKALLSSLANLPLKLISCFGDILSYLRLFAVGYASVMVAVSCNQMALGVGFSSIITSLGAALILLLGHTINIALGILSVLVHGLRLNMLEFSGHLNMEWSGRKYKPFRE